MKFYELSTELINIKSLRTDGSKKEINITEVQKQIVINLLSSKESILMKSKYWNHARIIDIAPQSINPFGYILNNISLRSVEILINKNLIEEVVPNRYLLNPSLEINNPLKNKFDKKIKEKYTNIYENDETSFFIHKSDQKVIIIYPKFNFFILLKNKKEKELFEDTSLEQIFKENRTIINSIEILI